jgi:hypothetical protein
MISSPMSTPRWMVERTITTTSMMASVIAVSFWIFVSIDSRVNP